MSRLEISREGKLVELGRDSIGGKETTSEIVKIRDRRMLGGRYMQEGMPMREGMRSGLEKKTLGGIPFFNGQSSPLTSRAWREFSGNWFVIIKSYFF